MHRSQRTALEVQKLRVVVYFHYRCTIDYLPSGEDGDLLWSDDSRAFTQKGNEDLRLDQLDQRTELKRVQRDVIKSGGNSDNISLFGRPRQWMGGGTSRRHTAYSIPESSCAVAIPVLWFGRRKTITPPNRHFPVERVWTLDLHRMSLGPERTSRMKKIPRWMRFRNSKTESTV
ncbi:hypothetical protein PM082_019139 [Marasmius tenuissimus]|nr:hypothetical protein PM082_019139 [Marasmius tenuissimus]